LPTVVQNAKDYGIQKINQTIPGSITDATRGLDLSDDAKKALDTFNQNVKRISETVGVRTIRRTTDTIALYMPDTMNFTQGQNYTDLSLQNSITKGVGAITSAADGYKSGNGFIAGLKNGLINLSPFFASLLPGNLGQAAFAVGFGLVHNPMVEMLYSSPQFRDFRFDFMFYPRSQKEAMEVQKILNKLHFHQAPEIRNDTYSVFLIPPSEFDIKFYYNGIENENIPKISTCVLKSIDVDYAPGGFSAYEVPGEFEPALGKTGMPVAIRLSLSFTETEFMTKAHYSQKKTREE
jgi:hypothetical protein